MRKVTEKDVVKYIVDGKVVILGQIELGYVVQKVLIHNGAEYIRETNPEIVREVFDSEVICWKTYTIRELEDKAFRYQKEIEAKTEELHKIMVDMNRSMLPLKKWIKGVKKQAHPDSVKSLLEGIYQYLENYDNAYVISDYDIIPFHRCHTSEYYPAVTFYFVGKDEYGWKIRESDTLYISYEEAHKALEKKLHSSFMSDEVIFAAEKYGITLDKDKVIEWLLKKKNGEEKNLEYHRNKLKECEAIHKMWEDRIREWEEKGPGEGDNKEEDKSNKEG